MTNLKDNFVGRKTLTRSQEKIILLKDFLKGISTNEIGRRDGRMKIHNFQNKTPKEQTTAFDWLRTIRRPQQCLFFCLFCCCVIIFNTHAPLSGV